MNLRYLFYLLILTGSGSLPCSAQETTIEKRVIVDSLYQLINSHPDDDEEKVLLLNEYARHCFFNYEILKGLIATKDARELAKKNKFKDGEIMYYLTLATFYGSSESIHKYYKRQAEWLSIGSDNRLMEDYSKLVFPIDYLRNLENSIDKLLLVYKYFEKIGDKEILASIINPIKSYYFYQSNYPETRRYVNIALGLYDDLGLNYPYFLYSTFTMRLLYLEGNEEAAMKTELELVDLIEKSEDTIGVITMNMALGFSNSGRFALGIEYHLKSIEAFKQLGNQEMLAEAYYYMGIDYQNLDMPSKALESYMKYLAFSESLQDSSRIFGAYNNMVSPLIALKNYEEARKYINLALQDPDPDNKTRLQAGYYNTEGQILVDQGQYAEAIPYFLKAFEGIKQIRNSRWDAPFIALSLSNCYLQIGDQKRALENALLCLEMENALNHNRTGLKYRVSLLLSEIYDKFGNREKAFEFLKMHQEIRAESDSLDASNRIKDIEVRAVLDKSQKEIHQLEEDRLQKEQENRIQRFWIFSVAGALISVIILSLVLYRNNQHKQKANALLKEQKEEIQITLDKLKEAQSQLIQSEKMASLGELTAGIAHEIQNPLNFVNNFSEVNKELISELKVEIDNGDLKEIKSIANDIEGNEEKINHHGQRASGIVKGMMEHSRTGEGVKEQVDINTLADEYLRLAYHGLRAKDKSFNADFKTDLDPSLPKINLVPQDIGRVLLNLINNAFFACNERGQAPEPVEGQRGKEFKPLVSISTKLVDKKVEISVKDNGRGIPEEIKDKIFQPFFTTKPTGSGTGLGLSLSYDIVKAHGGDIEVKSEEGNGTVFIVGIPIEQ